jgi:membrane-associated phospholipid phosphatase
MSFMFIPLLIPLSKMLTEKSGKKLLTILLIILVIGWALYVGVSRVIIGAHYASDVLFSGGAASIITILLYKWIYVKKANHDNTK